MTWVVREDGFHIGPYEVWTEPEQQQKHVLARWNALSMCDEVLPEVRNIDPGKLLRRLNKRAPEVMDFDCALAYDVARTTGFPHPLQTRVYILKRYTVWKSPATYSRPTSIDLKVSAHRWWAGITLDNWERRDDKLFDFHIKYDEVKRVGART